ncbi:hypothetical protein RR48_12146 [Papilio machaon]|uniref:Uncharacterized protein n=1 Tax=Papilio machaon TaxID=76193 RepID=A0A194QS94_PAPMA|nr:hypothetical protein RR48_12146 [Papilio machaon]
MCCRRIYGRAYIGYRDVYRGLWYEWYDWYEWYATVRDSSCRGGARRAPVPRRLSPPTSRSLHAHLCLAVFSCSHHW